MTGVLVLRMLRQDPSVYNKPRFIVFNTASLLVFIIVALLLGNDSVLSAGLTVLNLIGKGFAFLFSLIFFIPAAMLKEFIDQTPSPTFTPSPTLDPSGATESPIPSPSPSPSPVPTPSEAVAVPNVIIGGVIVIVLIAIVALIFFSRGGGGGSKGEGRLDRRERVKMRAGAGQASSSSEGASKAAIGIRAIYARLLRFFKKRKMPLIPGDTSLDVLKKTSKQFPCEPHQRLRGLYVRARYDDESRFTPQEVADARKAYHDIIQGSDRPFGEDSDP